MKASFYLGREFGYTTCTVEVEVIGFFGNAMYLVMLPAGHNAPDVVPPSGLIEVCADFLKFEDKSGNLKWKTPAVPCMTRAKARRMGANVQNDDEVM